MGILNVTPDSFSDGGKFQTLEKAVEHAKQMEQDGADIIDIGGESSGPNSKDVSEEEEIKRVIPIIEALKKEIRIPISVDTYKAKMAEEALKLGVEIINDITALRGDSSLAKIVAKYQASLVLMYSKDETARTTLQEKQYENVIETIADFFKERTEFAVRAGIAKEKIILDPGMGHFISSDPKYSFEVIQRLSELKKLGFPLLVGPSKKSFLGGKLDERKYKTLAAVAMCIANGASVVRVHDVKEAVEVREVVMKTAQNTKLFS